MSDPQKPGEKPQKPGEYVETGPRGGSVNKPREVTIDPRDGHLPPTQKPGHTWTPKPGTGGKREIVEPVPNVVDRPIRPTYPQQPQIPVPPRPQFPQQPNFPQRPQFPKPGDTVRFIKK